jgi:hypothetical protein
MTYKVFYTDVPLTPGVKEPNFSQLPNFDFDSRETAINKAMLMIKSKAVVWKIEGPNKEQISRAEIEQMYHDQTGKRPRT